MQDIKRTQPEILFIAISSPKKEFFIRKYMSEMQVSFSMGVGGSFDIIAGVKKRAPKWMQKCGLEWFFRLCQEPRRLWKRYLIGNPIFLWLVLKEFLKVRVLGRNEGLENK
ncbi:N-acetylglucosaminyldiphosphoundecaprenol N-acetyl-beta-D-mannosaminyltransferase [subsurface metagenome]